MGVSGLLRHGPPEETSEGKGRSSLIFIKVMFQVRLQTQPVLWGCLLFTTPTPRAARAGLLHSHTGQSLAIGHGGDGGGVKSPGFSSSPFMQEAPVSKGRPLTGAGADSSNKAETGDG